MPRLRVTPAREKGRYRLYVTLPDGRHAAWYEKSGGDGDPVGDPHDGGRISLVHEARREEVIAALAPYLTGDVAIGPPPVPTSADLLRLSLHPDDDLAPNRPGEALLGELAGREPPGRLSRRGPDHARFARLAAEETIGGELDRLEGAGWRVLHSVPLPGGDRIDHLAVGPGGVLAVHTLPAHRLRVRIEGLTVRTGRTEPVPLLRLTRRRAERASHALAVAVAPVLAVVGAARLELLSRPAGVRVLSEREIPSLTSLAALHKPADVDSLYAAARDRGAWSKT
ncbi:nuclease-related domain-containing protein [Streptomyces sp. NPDC014894]|uniref:nuclease-related domain-containing protein n=1 Tax=unclassified Streptomyces TaxID=2593676 RepID=UPI0036FBA78F